MPFVGGVYGSSTTGALSRTGGAYEPCRLPGRARGAPNRDGIKDFGRPIPLGEVGPGNCEPVEGARTVRAGDAGRPLLLLEGAGDEDRAGFAGEAGRARREADKTAGLAGRARPPIREAGPGAGDPDLGIPETRRVTWAGCKGTSARSGLLGPATRRRRSSSCVLSLGDNLLTSDQIFSPTRT